MRKITAEELVGKGNVGKPDIPGVSTAEMQRIMDEIPREVIIPAFNELSDEAQTALDARYTKTETDQKINEKVVAIGSGDMAKGVYDPGNGGVNVTVQLWNCEKTGSVYALTGTGAVGRFRVPAAWNDGDSFTVNGVAVPAYCGADPADGDCVADGRWLTFVFDGSRLDFNGGGGLSASKLAQATATENDVLAGVPFYAGNKTLKHGTLALTGNVTAGAMLEGSSGYASDPHQKINGNIPVRGAWGAHLGYGAQIVVPPGYHNGNGVVTSKTWTKDKYLYLVIQFQPGYGNPMAEHAATLIAMGDSEPGFLAHYSGGGNSNAVLDVCGAGMLNINKSTGKNTAEIVPIAYLYDIFHQTNLDPGVTYTFGPNVYCFRLR